MMALLACLLLVSLSVASPLTLVLPANYKAASEAVAPVAVGDALAHLSHAAADASSVLPQQVAFVPLSAAPVASHVVVLAGFSHDAIDNLPQLKAALESRSVVSASCPATGSCLVASLSEPARLADRVARYAGAEVTLAESGSRLGALLAPVRASAQFPQSTAAVEQLWGLCGAQEADVKSLSASSPRALTEVARICYMAQNPAKAGLTLVPVSALEDVSFLPEEERAPALRVFDAVLAFYTKSVESARAVASFVFSADSAPEVISPVVAAPVRKVAAAKFVGTKRGVAPTPLRGDKDAPLHQICIWITVTLIIAVVLGSTVMFGVGIDATKDTLLFRTMATLH